MAKISPQLCYRIVVFCHLDFFAYLSSLLIGVVRNSRRTWVSLENKKADTTNEKKVMNWKPIIPTEWDSLWVLSIRAGALYECPKDAQGRRLGPLVPYASKDAHGRNLVGEVYFNFAMIEQHVALVARFAELVSRWFLTLPALRDASTIIGIPDGGRTFGQEVARVTGKRFVYPGKVEREKAPGAVKTEFDLVFKRAELFSGETVIVTDDVHNNFKNTDEVLRSIPRGVKVVGLCSALNRSPKVDNIYVPKNGVYTGVELPVVSAIRRSLMEWEQDDPAVASDIAEGNLECEVKKNWPRLKKIMEGANK